MTPHAHPQDGDESPTAQTGAESLPVHTDLRIGKATAQ